MRDLYEMVDIDQDLTNGKAIESALILFHRTLITPEQFIDILEELDVTREEIKEFFSGGLILDPEEWDEVNEILHGGK